MVKCHFCGKEFLATDVEGYCDICTECVADYERQMIPRLSLLDKLILKLLKKHSTFKHVNTHGPDPYAGESLEIRFGKWFFLEISSVVSYTVRLHIYKFSGFYAVREWDPWLRLLKNSIIMKLCLRLFQAFDNEEELKNYETPYWVGEAERCAGWDSNP